MTFDLLTQVQRIELKSVLCVVVCSSSGGGGGSGDVVGPASASDSNIAVYDGTTGKLIKDSGVSVAGILASIPSLTNLMANIFFLDRPETTQAITNQPAIETFFISSIRHTKKFDATKYNYVRILANVQVASNSANSPRLYPKYKTTYSSSDTVGSFTTVGTGLTTETASLAAVDLAVSDWIALPAGAKADVFWCVAEIGGDGAADPALSNLLIQFKV